MSRNTQEYIESLINKNKIYFLDLNNWTKSQNHKCPHCKGFTATFSCKNCSNGQGDRQLKGEITDLKEFENLKGINVSNNELNNLIFLDTLPNKDKLKGINLFGNQITEVDFAELFNKFPNLEKINLANNPLSAKNLANLTSEQFSKLIQGIKDKTIRINSFKGTILADLFAYVSDLISKGDNNHIESSSYLQTLISNKEGSSPTKTTSEEKPNNNIPLLVGGLTLFGVSLLAIGFLWGQKKKKILKYKF